MHKRLILVFLLIIFFYSSRVAFATLFINEIMYDLPGSDSTSSKSREWIEVYNSGSSDIPIDASKWRIYDGAANKTINGEVDFSIPALSYVIFAGNKDTFLTEHTSFSGLVYDTGITSLNNSGATLKILDQNGNVVDSVSYTSSEGGAGDGNSLQKISSTWVSGVPTPGVANQPTDSGNNNSSSEATGALINNPSASSTSYSSDKNSTPKSKVSEDPKITTKIIMKNVAFVGAPILLQAMSFGYSKEQLHFGKYFWNFGDGDSKEVLANSTDKVTHTYFYPGEYAINLEYYTNPYSDKSDAVDTLVLKVIPEDIVISKVGDEKDFFVEVSNNMNNEADISGWVLSSSSHSFVFPRNTVLGSKKKMMLSPKITNLTFVDKDTLRLLTKEGDLVFDYNGALNANTPILVVNKKEKVLTGAVSTNEGNIDYLKINPIDEPFKENLEASAIGSNLSEHNSTLSSAPTMPVVIFLLFLGGGATSVYFIRKKKTQTMSGEDFEILN